MLSNIQQDLELEISNAHAHYAKLRPKSLALSKRAKKVMPNGSTRSVLSYRPFSTAIERGEDCRLWDIDGNEYLDLCGEYTAGLFGHNEPRIHNALVEALKRGINLAGVGEREETFARLLCERFPSIEQVRFTNSGTEANLMALATARIATGRPGILVFRGGYHGSVLTFPAYGTPAVTAPFQFIVGQYNDAEGARTLLRNNSDQIGAVLVEPMQGSSGCISADTEFLQALREETLDLGALLIFDEVMTSRMSDGGVQKLLGIKPDLTTLGKFLGGGMSFGAFGGRHELLGIFEGMPHSGTFNNNVLTMAAGCVALEELFTKDVARRLFERGEALRGALNAIAVRNGCTMQWTGLGSLGTPHFRLGDIKRAYHATKREDGLRELFFFDMLKAGFYLARRGMYALSLPVTDAKLNSFTSAVEGFCQSRAHLLQA